MENETSIICPECGCENAKGGLWCAGCGAPLKRLRDLEEFVDGLLDGREIDTPSFPFAINRPLDEDASPASEVPDKPEG